MENRSGRSSEQENTEKRPYYGRGTRKPRTTVSDETKRYKIDEEEIKRAEESKRRERARKQEIRGKNNKSNKRAKKKSKKKKTNIFLKILKRLIIIIIILAILAGLILAGIIAGIFLGFFGSDFKMTKDDLTIQFINSEVYDSQGNKICELNGNEKRKIVSLEDMPEYLPKAYVAIEDERFYEHPGVDIKRTGAATVTYLLNKGSSSFGGSTITQQLVKNVTNEKEDNAMRKVKEMARAIQIEKEISKDNILELYLNIIFVGGDNINGVALGAEYYFGKDVKDISVAEAAFLAGINHTPNSYNPYVSSEEQRKANIERGTNRTKTVLKKMKDLKYIDQEQYDVAKAEVEKGFVFKQGVETAKGDIYSDLTEAAIDQIVEQFMEETGMDRNMAEIKVYGGGYKIYTTEVARVQRIMENVMADDKYVMPGKQYKADGTLLNEQSQAAMVVIDPPTGKVVGCVGRLGKKQTNGVLNRAVQTKRQIGSAMKPIAVVGPAIQEGLISPSSVYEDSQTSEFTGSPWPKNYYTNFRGKQTVRECIEISGNVIPVRIMKQLGVGTSINYLNNMGLTGVSESTGLSLALGSKEFSVLQMTAAYATIANDGVYVEPTFYIKVVDSEGNIVMQPHQKKVQVFGKSEDYLLKTVVMQPVVGKEGTATYCQLPGIDTACKTGTTDSDKDRWLCGFTPYFAAAVWYGYDIGEQIIYTKSTPSNPSGGIWDAVMEQLHNGLPAKSFVRPNDIVTATVCHDSGLLPSPGCSNLVTDVFIKGKVPTTYCTVADTSVEYAICNQSGLIAVQGACPNVTYKKFPKPEEAPQAVCTMHKLPAPSPKPSVAPSPVPSPEPSVPPTPTPEVPTPNPPETTTP